MPIIIPKDIPATKTLVEENIFVMNNERANTQDIRPLEIAILNLMPTKIVTETQLLRLLSNSPLQVNVTFIGTESYVGKNTPKSHLDKFYTTFSQIKNRKFDGMIITGAPVEELEFEDVEYYEELKNIFEFVKTNVTNTIFICWGAQAGLNYYYGIEKVKLSKKLFGVFKYRKTEEFNPLFKGLDDEFYIPNSRHTTINKQDVVNCKNLKIIADSKEIGPCIITSTDNKFTFILGHIEYDRDTLEKEYLRDLQKGLDILPPENYYKNGKNGEINMCWASTGNIIYSNWLNHYVYQITPYLIDEI